ncbi:MAG: sulfotransferase family protein [Okeania sp. SIO3B5]|uniref:sulfotransferase-like domain-containing protein n=1 Tax=Okeania sp. SIO3B5 TaxID=2607811 RepID=UPI00140048D2|nr:sulfotransferase family protein [Okeania sp. SIO3B5]NEO52877.1 sulfotransferase family protein [Okeania sp. SIO3B5]
MEKILALWTTPRATSTAFECMMQERGDFEVHDEPFGLSYYYSKERCNTTRYPDIEPSSEYNFSSILEKLKQETEKQPVFIKDMSYYVMHIANQEFLSNFENTFLIRNPIKMLPSLFELRPDFTLKEAGYEGVYQLFHQVKEIGGKVPTLIDSDDLVKKPEATIKAYCKAVDIPFIKEALEWKAESQTQIKEWEGGWHTYALSSSYFHEPKPKNYAKIEDNAHLKQAYEYCLPYYQKLYEYRLRIE